MALLVRVLPLLTTEPDFALKGGTAINLFHRNLPRLSVDIDLTYLPTTERPQALTAIDAAMRRLAGAVQGAIPGVRLAERRLARENTIDKVTVRSGAAQIIIEVNPVLRGEVFPSQVASVSPLVEAEYGFAEARLLSFADLFAGKIVAALDRQHPRDLFDVRGLLADEGLDDDRLRRAFLIYLVSHHRPMDEVLAPTRKDIAREYERGFWGMTETHVAIGDLTDAREALIDGMVTNMPEDHRRFLLGFERGEPDWRLLDLPHAAELPGVRWRQHNLDTLTNERRAAFVARLEAVLSA